MQKTWLEGVLKQVHSMKDTEILERGTPNISGDVWGVIHSPSLHRLCSLVRRAVADVAHHHGEFEIELAKYLRNLPSALPMANAAVENATEEYHALHQLFSTVLRMTFGYDAHCEVGDQWRVFALGEKRKIETESFGDNWLDHLVGRARRVKKCDLLHNDVVLDQADEKYEIIGKAPLFMRRLWTVYSQVCAEQSAALRDYHAMDELRFLNKFDGNETDLITQHRRADRLEIERLAILKIHRLDLAWTFNAGRDNIFMLKDWRIVVEHERRDSKDECSIIENAEDVGMIELPNNSFHVADQDAQA